MEEMSREEYSRLWGEIHGRLTDEEKRFWARTAALNIESTVRRAERAEAHARWCKRVADILIVVNLLLGVLLFLQK